MGKRKRNKKTPFVGEAGVEDGEIHTDKRIGLEIKREAEERLKLTENQEDQLGKLSSSTQWIIKIAQGRGSNACLAISFAIIDRTVEDQDTCKATMHTLDGQRITVIIRGSWTQAAADVVACAGQGQFILLSGHGAKISSSGGDVVFEAEVLIVEVCNAETLQSCGYLEVSAGKVVRTPKLLEVRDRVNAQHDFINSSAVNISHQLPNNIQAPVENRIRSEETVHASPLFVRGSDVFSSPMQTPVRSFDPLRLSNSTTPGWLKTPVPKTLTPNIDATNTSTALPSEPRRSLTAAPSAPARSNTMGPKKLGNRLYTPISMLQCDDKMTVNIVGLTTTDHPLRRSLGGDQDWKVTIGITDVEQSNDPYSHRVSFNLFSSTEGGIPRCRPESILLLRGIKIKPFNNSPQGSGYRGQFEWVFMDTAEGDQDKAFTFPEANVGLCEAERKEMIRQYNWYRKHRKGLGHAATSTNRSRPQIPVSGMERELFFDTTVEVLKVWDHTRPFEMYVTDYTSHPLLYAANDVHLSVLSREELLEQQEDCNDSGNGRVLPISLWDDQEENVKHVNVGMLVHLENVRGKMQPNGYLCGTMGGSVRNGDEKLRVIVVRDKKIIEEFQKKKQEYLEVVALKRAEIINAARKETGQMREERPVENDDEEVSTPSSAASAGTGNVPSFQSVAIPSGMPPPGQKPLSIIDNHCNQLSQQSNSDKSSTKAPSQEILAPTSIEEGFASYPVNSIEDIAEFPVEQLTKERIFVCKGRVCDILPKNIEEIVKVTCGLCRTVLPFNHAFCAKCAEEDGKDLRYNFHFALCVEDVNHSERLGQEDRPLLPVVVKGEEARRFLHGFHPKDVRNRKSTMERLKKRLLPLLGSGILYRDDGFNATQQTPLPFWLAIAVRKTMQMDGSVRLGYSLTQTSLGKDGI